MVANSRDIIFYEAMWFGDHDEEDEPIVRGPHPELIIEELLSITEDDPGMVEVYKITYNKSGYSIKLHRKLRVLSELNLI